MPPTPPPLAPICPECGQSPGTPHTRPRWCSIWRLTPLLLALAVVAWFTYPALTHITQLTGMAQSVNTWAHYTDPPLTIAQLRDIAAAKPDSRWPDLRTMLEQPPRRSPSSILTSPYEVLAYSCQPRQGCIIMRRTIGWPHPWVGFEDWSNFATTATCIPLAPEERPNISTLANAGRGSWVIPSPDPRFTHEFTLDLNAIGLSAALLLVAWWFGRALRRIIGHNRQWTALLPFVCSTASLLAILILALPTKPRTTIWTFGFPNPAAQSHLRIPLSAGEIQSLIRSESSVRRCAAAILAAAASEPDDNTIGLALVLPPGTHTDSDMTIVGRFPSILRDTHRRLLNAQDAPIPVPALFGEIVWNDLPILTWHSINAAGVERFTLIDLPVIAARLMLAWAAWTLAALLSLALWRIRLQARIKHSRCTNCAYPLPTQ